MQPWWIKGDLEKLEAMLTSIKGKPETAMVRYMGDMRPELRADVYEKAMNLKARIEADIARFNEVGGDYDRM
jgi:hypothetical protein